MSSSVPAIPQHSGSAEEEVTRLMNTSASPIFELRVGWAHPSDDEELYFNIHFQVQGSDWYEILLYQSLAELNNVLGTSNAYPDFVFPMFPLIDGDQAFHFNRLLQSHEFSSSTVKLLDNHLRLLETWLVSIVTNFYKLNDDSKQYMKQLFFRSAEKMSRLDWLQECVRMREKGFSTDHVSMKKSKTVSILKAMGKLFTQSRGGGESSSHYSSSSTTDPTTDRMSVSSTTSQSAPSSSSAPSKRKSILSLNSNNLEKMNHQDGHKGDSGGGGGKVDYEARSETAAMMKSSISNTTGKERRKSVFGNMFQKKPLAAIGENDEDGGGSEIDGSANHDPNAPKSALEVANKSVLLRIEVQRAEASMQGFVVYDITIRVIGKKMKNPMSYSTNQRYSMFKKLWQQLQDINRELITNIQQNKQSSPYADFIHMIKAPFPFAPMKCYLGLGLNDSELSQRTRLLDAWFREVCFHYRNMPANARTAIRTFLNFDMSQPKDIFFQDQLAWGTIEMQNAQVPILIVNQAILDNVPDELMDEIETLTQKGGNPGNSQSIRQSMSFMNRNSTADKLDRQSVRSGQRGENAVLNDLIWETASQGGVSKISKKLGEKAPRTVILNKAKDW